MDTWDLILKNEAWYRCLLLVETNAIMANEQRRARKAARYRERTVQRKIRLYNRLDLA